MNKTMTTRLSFSCPVDQVQQGADSNYSRMPAVRSQDRERLGMRAYSSTPVSNGGYITCPDDGSTFRERGLASRAGPPNRQPLISMPKNQNMKKFMHRNSFIESYYPTLSDEFIEECKTEEKMSSSGATGSSGKTTANEKWIVINLSKSEEKDLSEILKEVTSGCEGDQGRICYVSATCRPVIFFPKTKSKRGKASIWKKDKEIVMVDMETLSAGTSKSEVTTDSKTYTIHSCGSERKVGVNGKQKGEEGKRKRTKVDESAQRTTEPEVGDSRKEAETGKEAENNRKEAENNRKKAENNRKEAENNRKEAENNRKEAENNRKEAEINRKEAENNRKEAEADAGSEDKKSCGQSDGYCELCKRIDTLETLLQKTLKNTMLKKKSPRNFKFGNRQMKLQSGYLVSPVMGIPPTKSWNNNGVQTEDMSKDMSKDQEVPENSDTEFEIESIKQRLGLLEKKIKEHEETITMPSITVVGDKACTSCDVSRSKVDDSCHRIISVVKMQKVVEDNPRMDTKKNLVELHKIVNAKEDIQKKSDFITKCRKKCSSIISLGKRNSKGSNELKVCPSKYQEDLFKNRKQPERTISVALVTCNKSIQVMREVLSLDKDANKKKGGKKRKKKKAPKSESWGPDAQVKEMVKTKRKEKDKSKEEKKTRECLAAGDNDYCAIHERAKSPPLSDKKVQAKESPCYNSIDPWAPERFRLPSFNRDMGYWSPFSVWIPVMSQYNKSQYNPMHLRSTQGSSETFDTIDNAEESSKKNLQDSFKVIHRADKYNVPVLFEDMSKGKKRKQDKRSKMVARVKESKSPFTPLRKLIRKLSLTYFSPRSR